MLENPDGTSGFTQVGEDVGPGVESIALPIPLFARVNARYILQSCNSGGCTDSATLTVPATLNDAVGVLRADTPEMLEKFGAGVSFSDDGNTLAIGTRANSADGDAILYDAGSVYIFTKEADGSWLQRATFESSQPVAAGLFGETLSLDADGDTLVVGAQGESVGANASGAVYVYSRQPDNTWVVEQRIVSESPESGDGFGISVTMADNGNTIAIGSSQKDVQGKAGETFVFTRNTEGTWARKAIIEPSHPQALGEFGAAVSLSADGNTLAVGARGDSISAGGVNPVYDTEGANISGATYVFTRSGDGTWTEQAFIKASNPDAGDRFGTSVNLAGDGNTLAVGSPQDSNATPGINPADDNSDAPNAGATYVFVRDLAGTWSQQAYIKSSKTGSPDRFGRYVSLDSDGDTLAVGAPQESSDNAGINPIDDSDNGYRSGAAYVFKRSADGTWTQQVMLKSLNPESPNFPSGATSVTAGFGGSLSLTADGASLAIGATGESPDSLGDDFSAGTVYLF